MGKANKQKAKKLAKKRAKTLLKSRDDDAMVIDDESAPAAPLTGRGSRAVAWACFCHRFSALTDRARTVHGEGDRLVPLT